MQSLEQIGQAAHSSWGDLVSTYELAKRCVREGIPGDFVECGVFGGSQAAAMAKAICDDREELLHIGGGSTGARRRIHLFDTFEGMPESGPQDRAWTAAGHKAGECAASVEAVQANMRGWGVPDELLVYHKGVFGHTLDGLFVADPIAAAKMPERIALLRLDLDLYDGTLAALQIFYHRLSTGGFCIADDFALDGARQAFDEYTGGAYPPIYWQKP